mgnify:CR=1 FL=1
MKTWILVALPLLLIGCKTPAQPQPDANLEPEKEKEVAAKQVIEPPSDAELMAMFCPEESLEDGACKVCFEGSLSDEPADEIVEIGDVLVGAFSAPGMTEALVTVEGCGRDASDFGEAVFMRRSAEGSWEVVEYFPLWSPSMCKWVERTDGTKTGVCETFSVQMGELTYAFWQAHFSAGEFEYVELYTATNNAAACPTGTVIAGEASLEGIAQVDGAPQVTIAYVEEVLEVPDEAGDACDAEERDLEFTSQGREAGKLVFVLGEDGRFRLQQ